MSAYVPILTADGRGLAGLAATAADVKDRLTPLVDVPASRDGAGARSRGLERRLHAVVGAVEAAFGRRRAYLDAAAVDLLRVEDGRTAAAWLFDEARARGLGLVPVAGLRRSDAYALAAADAASVDGRGVCLRLQLPDFADLDGLPERTHRLVDALGMPPEHVDLLVDLGRVGAEESRVLVVAARAVLSPLRRAARWRSVALAAGAATLGRSDGGGGDGRSAAEPRGPHSGWTLWRTLAADAPALRFGEYTGDLPGEPTGRRADDRGANPTAPESAVTADGVPAGRARPAAPVDTGPPAADRRNPDVPRGGFSAGAGTPGARGRDRRGAARAGDPQAAEIARHLAVTVEGIARTERTDD